MSGINKDLVYDLCEYEQAIFAHKNKAHDEQQKAAAAEQIYLQKCAEAVGVEPHEIARNSVGCMARGIAHHVYNTRRPGAPCIFCQCPQDD
jgi:hypothetical protein